MKFFHVLSSPDKLQLCRSATQADNVAPTFHRKFDVTFYVQWNRNQIVGNKTIYLYRTIIKIMSITAICLTTFFGKLTLNLSIPYKNHRLLSPTCSIINTWESFGRMYVNLWKMQCCHRTFERDPIKCGIMNFYSLILQGEQLFQTRPKAITI